MTTIRLAEDQKAKLEEAVRVLAATRGRKVSQGEAVAILADFASEHPDLLLRPTSAGAETWREDPFLDPSLAFDLGPTDERTHDRVLYGRK